MSKDYGFKKIGDIDLLDNLNNSANVIVEDSGVLKKMSAKNIGAVKSVNGIKPDSNGNIEIEIGSGEDSTNQSDWNQMDDTASNYIKNRTHYDEGVEVEIELLPAADLTFELIPLGYFSSAVESNFTLEAGQQYIIIIDGNRYIETAVENEIMGGVSVSLGENVLKLFLSLEMGIPVTYTKPFIITQNEGSIQIIMLESTEITHNVAITKLGQYLYKDLYNITNEKFDYIMNQYGKFLWDLPNSFIAGVDYTITWDGTEYVCKAISPEEEIILIGNAVMMGENTGEPFVLQSVDGVVTTILDLEHRYTPEENKTVNIIIDKQLVDGSYENIITIADFILTYNSDMSVYASEANLEGSLELNSIYKITYDNKEYICSSLDIDGIISLGNPSIIPDIAIFGNTEEPFLMGYNEDSGIFVYEKAVAPEVYHDIKISGYTSAIKTLNKKYIPKNIDIPVASSNTLGGVKVYTTTSSDLSNNNDYSKIRLSTYDNQIYAEKPTVPVIQKSTTDLTEGVSSLATGTIYLVYE